MKKYVSLAAGIGLAIAIGCSQQPPTTSAPTTPISQADGSTYQLSNEPEGAVGVIQVRDEAKDQDDVVIVGRIGGSESPWVDGRAAFSIVDLSLKSCAECGSDDCPKPWDYC